MTNKTIVRLTTNVWSRENKIHIKKTITYLRRKSEGYNILEEDINDVGYHVVDRILNLHECEDGIYQVIACNVHRDWETGNIEDYDYFLVKYNED